MNRKKVTFTNKEGLTLTGYVTLPLNQEPHNFALFAHCFTCNKNFFAPKNISKALSQSGYGIMRFDFTGLGESEGEFADSNFSGNVEDLIAAAEFLEKQYKAPSLLIGHSLGGAAVLFAGSQLPSVKAIATIGAPSEVKHVSHLLKSSINQIKEEGKATVNIGGRDFTIKDQFLEDLDNNKLKGTVENLDMALLIMHSPQDRVVAVKNAEDLYWTARHPKSFITLDGADHLLSDAKDSLYAGEVISAWSRRYVSIPDEIELESEHQVVANTGSEGFTTHIKSGNHYFIADEPIELGGSNYGPTPYEYISAALAACTSMTLQMYARRKKWNLGNVETHVSHSRTHAEDCSNCDKEGSKIDTFKRHITIEGTLDETQRKRLLQIADRCPVHRTLTSHIAVKTEATFN